MKLLAPNGKPSNLTPEQYRLVRTLAFIAWFGNWEKLAFAKLKDSAMDSVTLENLSKDVSKVVDENGEPLVVYHSGNKGINVFDKSMLGSRKSRGEQVDIGFYFGNKMTAELFIRSEHIYETYSVFLNIKNPYYVDVKQEIREYASDGEAEIIGTVTDIWSGKTGETLNSAVDFYDFDPPSVNERAIESNSDGFIIEGTDGSFIYNAFQPTQIKLADGRNSIFDGNNPDIRFNDGGEVDKETYKKWKSLVNMSKGELEKFYDSQEGKDAGLSASEASREGIDSGRESARWIMKMKDTPVSEWTPTMWKWAKKQISFISRMRGNKGGLYDDKGNKTRKHTSLLIWGHNPKKNKFDDGGELTMEKPTIELTSEKIINSEEFISWFGNWKDAYNTAGLNFNHPAWKNVSKAVDEDGVPLKLYHGTTHEWTKYSRKLGNHENDMGIGFYATSSLSDAERNYLGGGSDLKGRLAMTAEHLQEKRSISYERAKQIAEQRIVGDTEKTIEVYLRIKKPLIIAVKGWGGTNFDFAYNFDDETEQYEDSKDLIKLKEAFYDVSDDFGFSDRTRDSLWSSFNENIGEPDYKSAYQVIQALKRSDGLYDETYDEVKGGNKAYEFVAQVFRKLGFDGVIYLDASEHFKNMGVSIGTRHMMAFKPTQIKLADGTNTTFDSKNPDIRFSDGGKVTFNKKLQSEKEHAHTNVYLDGKYLGYYMKNDSPFAAKDENWNFVSKDVNYPNLRAKTKSELILSLGKEKNEQFSDGGELGQSRPEPEYRRGQVLNLKGYGEVKVVGVGWLDPPMSPRSGYLYDFKLDASIDLSDTKRRKKDFIGVDFALYDYEVEMMLDSFDTGIDYDKSYEKYLSAGITTTGNPPLDYPRFIMILNRSVYYSQHTEFELSKPMSEFADKYAVYKDSEVKFDGGGKVGGLGKHEIQLYEKLGFSKSDIKQLEKYNKFSEQLGDVLKIKDISNIKSGDKLAFVYNDTTYDFMQGRDYGVGEIGIDEQWGEWTIGGYPFDMQSEEIIKNKNNPEFELKKINNEEFEWSLYFVNEKMSDGGVMTEDVSVDGVTETENFKKWFGNSKFVDSNGNPKVYYHQTHKKNLQAIEERGFNLNIVGARGSDDQMPDGVFLKNTDEDISVGGKGEDVVQIPVYVRLENPIYFENRSELYNHLKDDEIYWHRAFESDQYDKGMAKKFDEVWKADKEIKYERGTEEHKKQYDEQNKKLQEILEEWKLGNVRVASLARARATEILKGQGYDGIVVRRDTGSFDRVTWTLVVFNPYHVKSAVNNIGTFDITQKGIKYDDGGSVSMCNKLYKDHHEVWDKLSKIEKEVCETTCDEYSKEIVSMWDAELKKHFTEEEDVLFPSIRNEENRYVINELLVEHKDILKLIDKIKSENNTSDILEFCNFMKYHIKKEENLMESVTPDPYKQAVEIKD